MAFGFSGVDNLEKTQATKQLTVLHQCKCPVSFHDDEKLSRLAASR